MNLPNVNPIITHLSKGSIIEFVVKIELGGSVPHLIKIEYKKDSSPLSKSLPIIGIKLFKRFKTMSFMLCCLEKISSTR